MTSSPSSRPVRPPDEVRATIEAFTDLDWLRVRKAAEHWAKACGADADDVMNDALERALDGSRQCPQHITIFQFLSGAMRSISSGDRKARMRRAEIHLVAEDGSLVVDPIDEQPNAAEAAQSQEAVEAIKQAVLGLFENDLAAQTIVEGDMDGIVRVGADAEGLMRYRATKHDCGTGSVAKTGSARQEQPRRVTG